MPILGQALKIMERTKSRTSKRDYFLKQGKEYEFIKSKESQKYVLDKTTPFPMPTQGHPIFTNQQALHPSQQIQPTGAVI